MPLMRATALTAKTAKYDQNTKIQYCTKEKNIKHTRQIAGK